VSIDGAKKSPAPGRALYRRGTRCGPAWTRSKTRTIRRKRGEATCSTGHRCGARIRQAGRDIVLHGSTADAGERSSGARAAHCVVQGLSAPSRARSCRDGCPIRRRDDCARLARAAGLLQVRKPGDRYGSDRDRAALIVRPQPTGLDLEGHAAQSGLCR